MSSSETLQPLGYVVGYDIFKACGGGFPSVPEVGQLVYYFAEGHAEYATSKVDLSTLLPNPLAEVCRVSAVSLFAHPESDEVFARISLDPLPYAAVPIPANPPPSSNSNAIPLPREEGGDLPDGASDNAGVVFYSKVLTQSDANNGGGFSVPRRCADSIFPTLDYTATPPVQTLSILDLHGNVWNFRHIFRGNPCRHLLTTGWSKFVNSKKLISGDVVVFIRNAAGELYVGIRRTCRILENLINFPLQTEVMDKEGEIGQQRRGSEGLFWRSSRGRISPESVGDAVRSVQTGQKFEVLYYPKIGCPEFVVAKELVDTAMVVPWCAGVRVKMVEEKEDSSRRWLQGTVSKTRVRCLGCRTGPIWGLLQIKWDEPDTQRRVIVNPWQVQLAFPNPYLMHSPTYPNTKKVKLQGNSLGPIEAQESIFPTTINLQGSLFDIQGARHSMSNKMLESSDKLRKTMLLQLPPFRPSTPSSCCMLCRSRVSANGRPPNRPLPPKLPLNFLGLSATGDDGGSWKLADIDRETVQQRLSSWLLKAQTLLTDVAKPLVKSRIDPMPEIVRKSQGMDQDMFFSLETTVDRKMPKGYLSFMAAVSIEHFARMNGLTGRKMQRIFRALAPEGVRDDARSLLEYSCFRYLSRDTSDFHPNLKEPTFQRLLFITMLAWENPYCEVGDSQFSLQNSSLQGKVVGENAFARIAPRVAGVADMSTAHHLFKALVGVERGINLSLWTTYITELVKVHQSRKSYKTGNNQLSMEKLLCIGYSRQRPVLKWEDNIAWPGNVTLTDSAIYFEGIRLRNHREPIRIDLTVEGARVEKAKVGPFGSKLFDSAILISSSCKRETWILEFVDFGGESRRDVWHASVNEITSLYGFIREYGPNDEDSSIHQVYGAHRGKRKAISSAANSIARLQTLQHMRKLSEDPAKLVQFSYLRHAPYGDIVLQTLAVNFWGGPLVKRFEQVSHRTAHWSRPSGDISSGNEHVFDLDGSVYLCKWMKSSSWTSSSSIIFWKNSSVKQGIVLAKNLVVSDLSLVERASSTCKERSQKAEKTQATIDAAMIKGIPSNIDLIKELMLPCSIIAQKVDKLRRWEEPIWTLTSLVIAYTVIFRNLLPYVFPTILVFSSATLLLLKSLKEQGRLGRSFGKVTIRDQPPSSTIQKIVAVKEAMSDLENHLQNLNISLLKLRTIVLAGQPETTTEFALLLLGAAAALLFIPFRYIAAIAVLDFFTRELEFRRDQTVRFMNFLKERWAAVYAAPVVVLPYEGEGGEPTLNDSKLREEANLDGARNVGSRPKT
ncbi:hypothetical protein HPP92_001083 [Vanilla planifolia]|uniref:Auxin response factor n=1 Tax=Vanilla planifolia TaxID=51239 RepID=A0A835S2N2_VANPL|nr:hypothetical protein HPP92_001083 [Vanilla planifolia]